MDARGHRNPFAAYSTYLLTPSRLTAICFILDQLSFLASCKVFHYSKFTSIKSSNMAADLATIVQFFKCPNL